MKKILERFIAGHPTVVMYGFTLGVTLGVGFVLSYTLAPHDSQNCHDLDLKNWAGVVFTDSSNMEFKDQHGGTIRLMRNG